MLCVAGVAACVGAGCETIAQRQAVERTFDYGQAFLPGSATMDGEEVRYRGAVLPDRAFVSEQSAAGYREFAGSWLAAAAARIRPGTRWPVVVFLHGCKGYAFYTTPVAEYYLATGAVVIAPNSMNRPGRAAMCKSSNMAYRVAMRKAEARLAFERLAAQTWVDATRIVLAGQSEGGNAVASYSGSEFAAHIITGTNCRHNGGAVSAPRGTPVLAIKGANDETYPDGRCSVGRRPGGSRSIVIPHSGHVVVTAEEAKIAIRLFLRECCGIGDSASASMPPGS